MKNDIKADITIDIPHLRFTVYVKDMSTLMGIEEKGCGYTCQFDEDSACLFFENLKENRKELQFQPFIAHECLHVIQILCKKYAMSIENESEHTAYLLTYMMDRIMNDTLQGPSEGDNQTDHDTTGDTAGI